MREKFFLFLLLIIAVYQSGSDAAENNMNEEIIRKPTAMILDKSGYLYDPADTSCDGFPKLKVETYPGTCLGLVLSRNAAVDKVSGKSFIKPRTIIPIPGKKEEFLVIDMGGWSDFKGQLFWLKRFDGKKFSIKLVKDKLNLPHGLRYPGDGYFYVGEKHKIIRFKFNDGKYYDEQVVIEDLASFKGHVHPLTQFVFDPRNGDLYINSGAPSDDCFVAGNGNYKYCPEEFTNGLGAIYRVPGDHIRRLGEAGFKIEYYEVAASGLRNSMAMAVHPTGKLLQAENAHDLEDFEEPYEELNVIDLDDDKRGKHYGWPYCYNFNATAPDWEFSENSGSVLFQKFTKPVDCTNEEAFSAGEYQPPYLLLPPHAAPLDMNYYNGEMFKDLFGGDLILSFHGHQPTGNRLVSYEVGRDGLPLLEEGLKDANFYIDQDNGCKSKMKFDPRGGMKRFSQYKELISGWSEIPGVRPEGNPVGFTIADDGSIFIVEDRKSRVILRLAKTAEAETFFDDCSNNVTKYAPKEISYLVNRHIHENDLALKSQYLNIQKNYVDKHCMGCHGNPKLKIEDIAKDEYSRLDYFVANSWITHGEPEESKLFGSIAHIGEFTPMPPHDAKKKSPFGSTDWKDTVDEIRTWVEALDSNIASSFVAYKVKGARNIRNIPTTKGSVKCGKFSEADTLYIAAGNLAEEIRSDGWIWKKVFMVPNHSRLFINKCSGEKHPKDGVFYVATERI